MSAERSPDTESLEHLFAILHVLTPAGREARLAELQLDPALRADLLELLAAHDRCVTMLRSRDGEVQALHLLEPSLPGRISDFEILDVLGHGGMGVVYRAMQLRPRRLVALKMLRAELGRPDSLQRFRVEAEALGRLQHPGIAQVHAVGEREVAGSTQPFLVLELVEGEELSAYARSRSLDVAQRCSLVAMLCDAVQHAHERGVVHRDLKPSNVLVAEIDEKPVPKILDFGVARLTDLEAGAAVMLTRTGMLVGTLAYMSPEQFSGDTAGVDHRADVYALGVVLYELLSGKLPLEVAGLSLTGVAERVGHEIPVALGRRDRRLAGSLEIIASTAMAKDPDSRYVSAAAMAEDLRSHLAHRPIQARAVTRRERFRLTIRRHRTLFAGILATLVTLTTGLIVALVLAMENGALAESEQRQRAAAERVRDRARAENYRSTMQLQANHLQKPRAWARMRAELDEWRPPASGMPELRGWEWYFLAAVSAAPGEKVEVPGRVLRYVGSDTVVCAGGNGLVRCNVADGPVPNELQLDAGPKSQIAISGDGLRAACLRKQTVRVVDVMSGAELATIESGARIARCFLDSHGERLAMLCSQPAAESAAHGWGVVVQEVASGRHLCSIPLPTSDVELRFSPAGDRVAVFSTATAEASGLDGISIFELDGQLVCSLPRSRVQLSHVQWLPDGTRLLAADLAGRVQLWEVAGIRPLASWLPEGTPIGALAVASDGTKAAFGGRSGSVWLIDFATNAVSPVGAGDGDVVALAFDESAKRLFSLGSDGLLTWDLLRSPGVRRFMVPGLCYPFSWDREGATVTASLKGKGAVTVDAATGAAAREWPGECLRYNHDGSLVAVMVGKEIRVLDRQQNVVAVHECARQPYRINTFVWSPIANILALFDDRWLCLWSPLTGEPPRQLMRTGHRDLRWRQDGAALLWVEPKGTAALLDIDSGELIRRFESSGGILDAAISPDGSTVAIGCADSMVRVVDVASGSEQVLVGHTNNVTSIDWAPDGSQLVSAGEGAGVIVWDLPSGKPAIVIPFETATWRVHWSPDGRRIAAMGVGGLVILSATGEYLQSR